MHLPLPAGLPAHGEGSYRRVSAGNDGNAYRLSPRSARRWVVHIGHLEVTHNGRLAILAALKLDRDKVGRRRWESLAIADIFISYAREDTETAHRLADALAEQGWSVFWDRVIPAGRRFDDYLEEQVKTARCVIVLWSSQSATSPWVREEASEGRERGVLVPARLDNTLPPFGFRAIQAVDLIGWPANPSTSGFAQLLRDIETHLGPPAMKPGPGSASAAQAAPATIDPAGYYQFALRYEKGDGMPNDDAEAARWYRKVAEQGHKEAQTRLGDLYREGRGVLRDRREAVRWYRMAAEQGEMTAQFTLGSALFLGEGVTQDLEEALVWIRKAAEKRNVEAQFIVGWHYFRGAGIKEDLTEAVVWMRKAAEQGHRGARKFLELYKEGKDVLKNADLTDALIEMLYSLTKSWF